MMPARAKISTCRPWNSSKLAGWPGCSLCCKKAQRRPVVPVAKRRVSIPFGSGWPKQRDLCPSAGQCQRLSDLCTVPPHQNPQSSASSPWRKAYSSRYTPLSSHLLPRFVSGPAFLRCRSASTLECLFMLELSNVLDTRSFLLPYMMLLTKAVIASCTPLTLVVLLQLVQNGTRERYGVQNTGRHFQF